MLLRFYGDEFWKWKCGAASEAFRRILTTLRQQIFLDKFLIIFLIKKKKFTMENNYTKEKRKEEKNVSFKKPY